LVKKAESFIRNQPTEATTRMRDLLDKYEDPPPFLTDEERKIFVWFRSLNKTMLDGENQVRRMLKMPEIPYRKAYVRHIAESMADKIGMGEAELPEGLKYWSSQIVGGKIFNAMELRRKLADDIENYFTKDLAYATKSMVRTALKEIHLSQPLRFFKAQMGALGKDIPVYKNLTPEENLRLEKITTIPASTRKWVDEYVRTVIKGQQSGTDAEINQLMKKGGLEKVFNKILKPFGRSLGRQPITKLSQLAGRAMIYSLMTPRIGLAKMLVRNLFQHTQDLALYGIIPSLKGYMPAKGTLGELLSESLFLKGYTGIEELPVAHMQKLISLGLKPYGMSAVFNAKTAMKTAYHATMPLITNPKYKDLGWADPARTYKEDPDFLYPSERKALLGEMELGAGVTQYSYIGMGMPEIFRHKTLAPLTRLQSWWMNHFMKFHQEAAKRAFAGKTSNGKKLPWSMRVNYFKYLIIGGAILTSMGYEKSFGLKVLPYNWTPVGQCAIGLYEYARADEDWQKEKALRTIYNSWKGFVPGYLLYEEFEQVWNGEKTLPEIFFYDTEGEWPPKQPNWSIPGYNPEDMGGLPSIPQQPSRMPSGGSRETTPSGRPSWMPEEKVPTTQGERPSWMP